MPSDITSSEAPRVLVVDDNAAMLARTAAVLADACIVVGTSTDGSAAIEAAAALRPDVIVLDVSMPGMDGFQVAAQLRASGSNAAIVFLTIHDEEEFVMAARAVGALGYVVKSRLASDLMCAVRNARARRSFVSTSVEERARSRRRIADDVD